MTTRKINCNWENSKKQEENPEYPPWLKKTASARANYKKMPCYAEARKTHEKKKANIYLHQKKADEYLLRKARLNEKERRKMEASRAEAMREMKLSCEDVIRKQEVRRAEAINKKPVSWQEYKDLHKIEYEAMRHEAYMSHYRNWLNQPTSNTELEWLNRPRKPMPMNFKQINTGTET